MAASYWIGFGCLKDDKVKDQWLREADMSQVDVDALIDKIGEEYQGTNRLPKHVLNELGFGVLQTHDRAEEYQALGQLYEAETRLSAEIYARKAVFGDLHRCVARLQGELAQVLQKQGQYEEAEKHQEMVAKTTEKAYGIDHPSSNMARLVLADIWTRQGFPRKARPVIARIVPLLRKAMGEKHPDVLVAMELQAFMLASEGHLGEAADVGRQVVTIRSSMLGSEHPLTIHSQLSLVTILRADGQDTEAVEVMRSVEANMGSALGSERITRVATFIVQALLYQDLWLVDDAMDKIRKAHAILDKMRVGRHDRLRLEAYEVEAGIYHVRHQMAEEEVLLRQIIKGLDSEPHRNKDMRISTLSLLGKNMLWQRRNGEARTIAEEIIQSLGPTPLRVSVDSYIRNMRTMAEALSAEGQQMAAEKTLQSAYQACLDEFGHGHYATTNAAESLTEFWNQQRRYSESQECLEKILDQIRHRPGKSAIRTAWRLAMVLRERGQYERAANVCSEAVRWATAAGGNLHEDTLTVENILASIRIRLGDLAEAERILLRIDSHCRDPRRSGYIKMTMCQLREKQCRHEEALELAVEAYRLLEVTYDPIDRLTQEANVLRRRFPVEGLSDSLEQDILENIRRRGELQGERNPGRIAMMADLAYYYSLSRRLADAKNFFDQVEMLGGVDELEQPAECATVLAKQANVSFCMGRLDEAEALERRALDIRQRTYGREHDVTLVTKSNLASTLASSRRYPEAESLLREVLEARSRGAAAEQPGNLGATPSSIVQKLLATKKDLALVLFFQGRLAESVSLFEGALATAVAAGGPPGMFAQLSKGLEMVRRRIAQVAENQTDHGKGEGAQTGTDPGNL